jgi:RNA polymerase sigma-70 factor (ECF subfamily)
MASMISTMTWSGPRVNPRKETAEPSDETLMARVARRDSQELALLYGRYSAFALGLATKILNDRATGEEIVQEAFWRVWIRARTYCKTRGQFAPWLLSVVHNLAIDELRKRNARPGVSSTDQEDQVPSDLPDLRSDVAATALSNIAGEQVRAAVALLPEPQRHVLELAYFQGLTHQAISEKLGEPLGTVHTRSRLAIMKLREQLLPLRMMELS